MSGEGYTGHVNGDSAPYQFKIPVATSEQTGVMSKEQAAKLAGIPDGGAGVNAFTTLRASFVQPAVNASVTVNVVNSAWIAFGQIVYVENGGYYQGAAQGATQAVLKNLGYAGNAAPGATVTNGSQVSPGGLQGSSESSFAPLVSVTSGAGAETFYGISGSDADPANVGGRTVNGAISFTKVKASISPGVYVAPAPVYRIKLYVSTDGGISYSVQAAATVSISVGTSNQVSATFAAVTLPAGSLHLISVQQLSGGSNTVNRPLSVTYST